VNRAAGVIPIVLLPPVLVPAVGGEGSSSGLVPLLLPLPVVVVGGCLFAVVRVVVGPNAVVAGLGPWAWPRRRILMSDIRSARAEVIEPTDVGGWGYRLGRNGAAIVVRRGEALVLELDDGPRFTVTVDDAAEAAAIVNAYVAMK
jgi:hypothetical protein